MSAHRPILPIGTRVRVLHGSRYRETGIVVRGRPEPRPGYAYVEFKGHLPSTSVLMAVASLEVMR